MTNTVHRKAGNRSECGAAAVEFALIAVIFFTIVFGIMELGRMLFMWNTVQEATRRAAREAVVRNFSSDVSAIQREAVFQPGTTGTVYLPASTEISNLHIRLSYLNGDLAVADPPPTDPIDNISACKDATRINSCIQFVEACVSTDDACGGFVKYAPMIGLFPALAIDIPTSSVIMPAESLGFSVSP